MIQDKEITEKYMLYVRGFGDGAKSVYPKFQDKESYMRGYNEGHTAKNIWVSKYCSEIGYDQAKGILRD